MKSDVQNALGAFAERQESQDYMQKSKEEKALENREKRLKGMREKLRARQEHAAKVRERKQLTASIHAEDDAHQTLPKLEPITEDTPVGPKNS